MTIYTYSHPNSEIKHKLNAYAWKHFNQEPQQVENTCDPKTHWVETYFSTLIKALKPGDVIITDEAAHIGCSIVQLLEVLEILSHKQVDIYFVKYGLSMRSTAPDTLSVLKLINIIEREFISNRTTLALGRRRAKGLPLGRPKGRLNKSLKLDRCKPEIEKYLGLGVSKASIAKIVACHPQTLYDWLDRGRNRGGEIKCL